MSGVAHEDVHVAVTLTYVVDQLASGICVGEVSGVDAGIAAIGLDLRAQRLELVLRAGDENDVRSGFGQTAGGRPPDPRRSAGDQDDLAADRLVQVATAETHTGPVPGADDS